MPSAYALGIFSGKVILYIFSLPERLRTLRQAILWDGLTQKRSLHGLCNDPFMLP